MRKHREPRVHSDQRRGKYKGRKASYETARHRAFGPPQEPTIYDLTPDEFTQIKGAGPRY